MNQEVEAIRARTEKARARATMGKATALEIGMLKDLTDCLARYDKLEVAKNALAEAVVSLNATLLRVRDCVLERVDLTYGNAGSYYSWCMECGEGGEADKEETIRHHENCPVGHALILLDKALGIERCHE